ncbi:MAG: nuclease-related domain-containing protein [Hyphomicrobiales bacterium]
MNSSGIHAREAPGLKGLAEAFPEHWLLYASFQCFPQRSAAIEIDAMVVMDDRVILLELKDWHGELAANGDQWLVNGRTARSVGCGQREHEGTEGRAAAQ